MVKLKDVNYNNKAEGRLSKRMEYWKNETPDQWVMGSFIVASRKMERTLVSIRDTLESGEELDSKAIISMITKAFG